MQKGQAEQVTGGEPDGVYETEGVAGAVEFRVWLGGACVASAILHPAALPPGTIEAVRLFARGEFMRARAARIASRAAERVGRGVLRLVRP